ncbi:MAG: hypothetical protein JSV04_05970 [Candidatus Heimdallarchaeota archaeon]|nr:MAG: hypothetical protein JSV04_05970 [Candidatus Heimdallarchaeota archaeon]
MSRSQNSDKSAQEEDFHIKRKEKAKTILLRVSDPLYDSIRKAIELGIADNASEFVRRCVVNQLLDLRLLGIEEKD